MKRQFFRLLDTIIRFIHAAPKHPNGDRAYGLGDLKETCKAVGAALLIARDMHTEEAVDYVRRLTPDLGLALGARMPQPVLSSIPVHGSVKIRKGDAPDYVGEGIMGLQELLDDRNEIAIAVDLAQGKVGGERVIKSAMIPIEPFDAPASLALKADVVATDLIVATIRDFVSGTVTQALQTAPSGSFTCPPAEELWQMKRQLARRRKSYGHPYRRPPWKLFIKSVLYAPKLVLQNWQYRLRKDFPVVILFHHLVTDRPHRLGVSTAYFLRQVNYLFRHYRMVSLREAIELIRKGGVVVPTVAVTFDDGYADNFINLRAVTEETGLQITYFISTGHMSNGREFDHDEWFDTHGFLPNTWEQVEFLKHFGYEIGSHSRNHADCGSTDLEFLRHEIVGSGEEIRQKLGPTTNFSFPFGQPVNISAPAVEVACASYENVFCAYGGGNFHADRRRILKRSNFPYTLWEMELQVQSILAPKTKEPPHLQLQIE